MLSFLVLLALAFCFLNGFHDAANSIATVVSTRVLRPLQAVAWAAAFNFLAIFLLQMGVATTIATGLVEPAAIDPAIVFGALAGGIIWNVVTLRLGIPISSAHALISALVGATLVSAGPGALVADGVLLFVLFVLLAPLIGLMLGLVLMVAVFNIFRRVAARSADRLFRRLQLVSSALYSLGHGSNDAQKTVGIIWLLLIDAGRASTDAPPGWVSVASYGAIAGGTLLGGWRIVRTMGQRIVKLAPAGGFCAESAGAGATHLASFFGIPISTTHTITASIVGVGIANRLSSVRWGVAGVIAWAWFLTLPAAGLLGALGYFMARRMA
ncbi:MAG TPA: inorganic phosphate transporter [Lautropia sp.]|nr:inorganic phosphate transporter [Lautropia sp.]